MMKSFRAILLLLSAALMSRGAVAQVTTAVEYFNEGWGYYFVTAFPDEIAYLDGGGFGGAWKRSGLTFRVWSAPVPDAQPTCRFFTTAFAPRSSHVYTPYPDECAAVKANPSWQFESVAFYLKLPLPDGTCPTDSETIYRVYNNGAGGAPNHRYTPDGVVASRMQHAGWTLEGARPGVLTFACAPIDPIGSTVQGIWHATTDTGSILNGIVLSNDSFYGFYTAPGTNRLAGVYQGFMLSVLFASSGAQVRDFALGAPPRDTFVSGSFVPRGPWTAVMTEGAATTRFTATFDPAYERPALPTEITTTFTGTIGSAGGSVPASLTIGPGGSVSANLAGCAIRGLAAPHPDAGVFDLDLTLEGDLCPFQERVRGVAYYDPVARTLHAAAPNAARSDAFIFTGSN